MYMKAEIDALCRDLMTGEVAADISAPIVLMVYLGEETYNVVNASLEDAFTTSFKIKPEVHNVLIKDSQMTSAEILNIMVESIKPQNGQVRRLEDVRFTFVSLMNDPIFDSNADTLAKSICDAMTKLNGFLRVMGANTRKTSFYGIFRQMIEDNGDYPAAFRFISAGKSLWKNIYHMEVSIFDSGISNYIRTMALHNMCDSYTMEQVECADDYSWKSVYAHCLRVPELIVAKLLQKVYTEQVNGKGINQDEWVRNVNEELGQVFAQWFEKPEYHCEQYVPLNFSNITPIEQPSRWGRKNQTAQPVSYDGIIKDENSLRMILEDLYGCIELNQDDYEQIMERIISAASAIDNNHANISVAIQQFLERTLDEYEREADTLKNEARLRDINVKSANEYIYSVYSKMRKVLILDKKIHIVKNLMEQLKTGSFINRMIQTICKKNREYTDVLHNLIANEYGGITAGSEFPVDDLPSFTVNEPADQILKKIGHGKLGEITSNSRTIYTNLREFLNHTLTPDYINKGHDLGEINGDYYHLNQILPSLMMTSVQKEEVSMQALLNEFPNLPVVTNNIYRENSFYVITERLYSSNNYIVRYKI